MDPKLILPYSELENSYNEYVDEWESYNEPLVPAATIRGFHTFSELLEKWREETTEEIRKKDLVPSTLYFLIDENEKILGAIHLRHELNDFLFKLGGNIGYGVRPTERKKGYASVMLKLVLEKCKTMNMKKVLVTCIKGNTASANTILANGGVLENEVYIHNKMMQRYWIIL
ncbi:MAG: GNAT family N-acetyltransferase [Candidatus Delongbacteria bacterium]|jgi:predicted acetyltransferase|nr:GNAT family N-acetyltransferase [Candidatus Delongbacteria bacterium]